MPILSLLPADQHHFAGLLALRLLCVLGDPRRVMLYVGW